MAMIRRFTTVNITVVLVLASAGLIASQEPRTGQAPRAFGPGAGFALFNALDTNHDGVLSAAEIAAAPDVIKALDRNADGRVTPDEIPQLGRDGMGGRDGLPGREGRGGPGRGGEAPEARPTSPDELVVMLMAFDRNGDGVLTKEELPERFQGLFDRADTDKNGKLTPDELRKSAAASPQPSAPAGGGGERGEGRRGEGGDGRQGGRGDGRGMGPMTDLLIAALDTNSDGVLSAEEIAAAPARLRTLDRNNDGAVSRDEINPPGRGRG